MMKRPYLRFPTLEYLCFITNGEKGYERRKQIFYMKQNISIKNDEIVKNSIKV